MPSDSATNEAFDVRQEQHFGGKHETAYALDARAVTAQLAWLEYRVEALKRENELLRERIERLEDDRR